MKDRQTCNLPRWPAAHVHCAMEARWENSTGETTGVGWEIEVERWAASSDKILPRGNITEGSPSA